MPLAQKLAGKLNLAAGVLDGSVDSLEHPPDNPRDNLFGDGAKLPARRFRRKVLGDASLFFSY